LPSKGFPVRKPLLVAAISLIAIGTTASPAFAVDQFNCGDFSTQQKAQAVLNADKSDPNGLDRDKDGIACEDLPSGPASSGGTTKSTTKSTTGTKSQITSVPSGGADSGGGSTSGVESLGLLTAGGGLVLLSGVTLLVRRRLG
jgi:hypothetical protein